MAGLRGGRGERAMTEQGSKIVLPESVEAVISGLEKYAIVALIVSGTVLDPEPKLAPSPRILTLRNVSRSGGSMSRSYGGAP